MRHITQRRAILIFLLLVLGVSSAGRFGILTSHVPFGCVTQGGYFNLRQTFNLEVKYYIPLDACFMVRYHAQAVADWMLEMIYKMLLCCFMVCYHAQAVACWMLDHIYETFLYVIQR